MALPLPLSKEADDHFKLGQNYEELHRFDEAIAEYTTSLAIEFRRDVLIRLIQVCRGTGRRELLEKTAARALATTPEQDVFLRNIILNEQEMAQGKIVLESKIRSFTITLTNRCNLACKACEARQYQWDIPRKTIDEIIEYLPYLEYIMWQGGEVFLMDYFGKILEQTKRFPQIKQLIVTNAMLLSQDLIEELVAQPDMVLALSVDGTTKEIYEDIRCGAKFEKLISVIETINRLRRAHGSLLRLHLNVTVMRSNFFQLVDFIEFARGYGFYSVLLRPVQGNSDNLENIFRRKDKDALAHIERVIDEVTVRAKSYDIILDNRLPRVSPAHSVDTVPVSSGSGEKPAQDTRMLCYAPWQRMYISWGGNVYPDCMCNWPLDKGIANVDRESIHDVWNGEGMQTYRRRLLKGDYAGMCTQDCVEGRVPQRYLFLNK
ncbi:MAG: radical SAM protein [Candidatus Omnitrophica bacterium]|nr:radical SAM protein [Candidatus Omnitrophota bacterium]